MEIKDFVSMGALALSGFSVAFAIRYARINVLHSIQKMILDKSKDCNKTYSMEFDKWANQYIPIAADRLPFNFKPTIYEMFISVQLLDSSLEQFKHKKLRKFFLQQFWIQLGGGIRDHIRTHVNTTLVSEEITQRKYLVKQFEHLFAEY